MPVDRLVIPVSSTTGGNVEEIVIAAIPGEHIYDLAGVLLLVVVGFIRRIVYKMQARQKKNQKDLKKIKRLLGLNDDAEVDQVDLRL